MKKLVKTDVKEIREKKNGEIRIYLYLPVGVRFFGRFWGLFCRFPGVDYFIRIIYWDSSINAIVIAIPAVLDPDEFKAGERDRTDDPDDVVIADGEPKVRIVYECYGDCFVPRVIRR